MRYSFCNSEVVSHSLACYVVGQHISETVQHFQLQSSVEFQAETSILPERNTITSCMYLQHSTNAMLPTMAETSRPSPPHGGQEAGQIPAPPDRAANCTAAHAARVPAACIDCAGGFRKAAANVSTSETNAAMHAASDRIASSPSSSFCNSLATTRNLYFVLPRVFLIGILWSINPYTCPQRSSCSSIVAPIESDVDQCTYCDAAIWWRLVFRWRLAGDMNLHMNNHACIHEWMCAPIGIQRKITSRSNDALYLSSAVLLICSSSCFPDDLMLHAAIASHIWDSTVHRSERERERDALILLVARTENDSALITWCNWTENDSSSSTTYACRMDRSMGHWIFG